MDDIEAIKQLKGRYFRTMDTKDWEGFRDVFSDDVSIDTTDSGGEVVEGADKFVDFVKQSLDEAVTVHHGHTPEIEIHSPTTASGVWAMEDRLRWPNGREIQGYGHYTETYEKTGGTWRIKTSKLTRLWLDISRPDEP